MICAPLHVKRNRNGSLSGKWGNGHFSVLLEILGNNMIWAQRCLGPLMFCFLFSSPGVPWGRASAQDSILSRRRRTQARRNSNPSRTPRTLFRFPIPENYTTSDGSSVLRSGVLPFRLAPETHLTSPRSWPTFRGASLNRSPHWLNHPGLVAGIAAHRLNGAFGLSLQEF